MNKYMSSTYSYSNQSEALITSKWTAPIEGFTSHPKYTRVLEIGELKHIDYYINKSLNSINKNQTLLVHETTKESAINIKKNGFEKQNEGTCSIRDNAIFGWVHKSDVGYYSKDNNENLNYVVLFSVPKNKTYVSSYHSSIKQLIMGDITDQEYQTKHIMKYDTYVDLYKYNYNFIRHLGYDKDSFITNKI